MALITRSRVWSRTSELLFSTADTVAFDTSANRATSCIVARRALRSVIGDEIDDEFLGRRRPNLNASERVQWTTSMAVESGGVKRGRDTGHGAMRKTRPPSPVPRPPLAQSERVSHPFERVMCNGVGPLRPIPNN